MATLLFLIVHALKGLRSDYESYWFCLCVGLDQLALIQVLRFTAYLKR